jgi:hypothetical protein
MLLRLSANHAWTVETVEEPIMPPTMVGMSVGLVSEKYAITRLNTKVHHWGSKGITVDWWDIQRKRNE